MARPAVSHDGRNSSVNWLPRHCTINNNLKYHICLTPSTSVQRWGQGARGGGPAMNKDWPVSLIGRPRWVRPGQGPDGGGAPTHHQGLGGGEARAVLVGGADLRTRIRRARGGREGGGNEEGTCRWKDAPAWPRKLAVEMTWGGGCRPAACTSGTCPVAGSMRNLPAPSLAPDSGPRRKE
jgi:hypothetical protein